MVLLATREAPASAAIEAQFGLRESFRPTICEVSVAEILSFGQSHKWGEKRQQLLRRMLTEFVVLPISDPRVHQCWAELHTFAKERGLPIYHDHNDIWIAALANVTGLTVLSTDKRAFAPLRGTKWLSVVVLDPITGDEIT
ncbi:MAG: hypothetical protein L6Q99_03000 [Planctomycetes bacterium]|nr:hypothetical protein [Planctomycetota bacterium]